MQTEQPTDAGRVEKGKDREERGEPLLLNGEGRVGGGTRLSHLFRNDP